MSDSDPYAGFTDEELETVPTVFRDGLFAGQVVLVSGGAGGIGRAACCLFGRLGASIVACGGDGGQLRRALGPRAPDRSRSPAASASMGPPPASAATAWRSPRSGARASSGTRARRGPRSP